jgi:transposase
MGRRTFTREFKLEAVKLVTERGISKSQAARDLGIHVNLLRKWIEDFERDDKQAFPGRGKLRADDAEIAKLKRELADTKAERDILKKAIAYFAKERR